MSTWEVLPELPTERGEKIAYKSKCVLRNILPSPITYAIIDKLIHSIISKLIAYFYQKRFTSRRPTAIESATPVDLKGLFPCAIGQGSL